MVPLRVTWTEVIWEHPSAATFSVLLFIHVFQPLLTVCFIYGYRLCEVRLVRIWTVSFTTRHVLWSLNSYLGKDTYLSWIINAIGIWTDAKSKIITTALKIHQGNRKATGRHDWWVWKWLMPTTDLDKCLSLEFWLKWLKVHCSNWR